MSRQLLSTHLSFTILRAIVAGLIMIHGIARMALEIVDDFGMFLEGVGLPFGAFLAWFITLFEILGGLAFMLGKGVRPIALYFAFQLLMGIGLVHAKEGWFVVGAGRNGVEYSILLIVVLLVIATASPSRSPDNAPST